MLGVSTLVLAIFGFGITSIFLGDEDDNHNNETGDILDSDIEDSLEDAMEIVPPDTFLIPNETPETNSPQNTTAVEQPFETAVYELEGGGSLGEESMLEQEELLLSGLVTGGPGDTLVGGFGLNNFVVSLGEPNSETTIIEDLFFILEDLDLEFERSNPLAEVIWFTDAEGDLLTRSDMLAENIHFEEDKEIPCVTLHFEEHQMLSIQGLTLAGLTDNSLVIGNFQIDDT